jgi:hypothetical protein
MSLGRWRWVILSAAVLAVGVAGSRERTVVSTDPVPVTAVTVSAVVDPGDPEAKVSALPAWCAPLEALSADDSPEQVAAVFDNVAESAPANIAADLRAGATVLRGGSSPADSVEPTEPSDHAAEGEGIDAEGRTPEDDPLVRVADILENSCRRTSSNPGPAAVSPVVDTPEPDS